MAQLKNLGGMMPEMKKNEITPQLPAEVPAANLGLNNMNIETNAIGESHDEVNMGINMGNKEMPTNEVNNYGMNGYGMNGYGINGYGMGVNGMNANGMGVNGMNANGISVNGMGINGMSMAGTNKMNPMVNNFNLEENDENLPESQNEYKLHNP